MVNYLDKYPRCADCPRIKAWQASSESMAQALEVACINDSLARAEAEHFSEEKRLEIDETYAEILDRAKDGYLPEDVTEEARIIYASIEESANEASKKLESEQKLIGSVEQFLNSINDSEVELLASKCRGPRQISLFGLQSKAKCRSRMRRLALNPPPPMPK